MSKTTSVPVGEHFADFIERQVQAGRYDRRPMSCAPGCGFWKSRRTQLERLRTALIEVEQSGEPCLSISMSFSARCIMTARAPR